MIKSKLLNKLASGAYNIAIGLDISHSSTGIVALQWDDDGKVKGILLSTISFLDETIDNVQELRDTESFKTLMGALYQSVQAKKHNKIWVEKFNQVGVSVGEGATEKICVSRFYFREAIKQVIGDSWSMWDVKEYNPTTKKREVVSTNSIATNSIVKALKDYHNAHIKDGELMFSQIMKKVGSQMKENSKWKRVVAFDKFLGGTLLPEKTFTLKEKEDLADAGGICIKAYNEWNNI